MNPLEITKKYFEVSNESNFREIEKLLSKSSTYSSQNTGLYLGVEDIIEMQKGFHGSFEKLSWEILSTEEEKPGIVRVDFLFLGIKEGENIEFEAVEYVVVFDSKIQHIEIRNK